MRRRALLSALSLLGLALAGVAQAARIVAVGDVHGEIDGFDSVLEAAELVDGDGRWVGGEAVLVQTGDVTDRGSRVRAVMDRLRSLEAQAPAQGGRVVALLGNHEIYNLLHLFDELSTPPDIYRKIWSAFADERSERRQRAAYKRWHRWVRRTGCVHQDDKAWLEDRKAWLEDHPPGYVEYIEALSPDGEYGRWLRGLRVVAEIDGVIFLHGGLSRELVEQGYRSVEAINEAAVRVLAQLDEDRQRLVDEELILPFSTEWELRCALFVEQERLQQSGKPDALARRAELEELQKRLPLESGSLVTDAAGPVWFRGLATGTEADMTEELEFVLEAFGAERIVVGHTPQTGKIRSRFGGRVYLIDTAMAYAESGGRASALEIDGDRVTAIYPDERVLLAGESAQAQPAVESTNGHGGEAVEGTNGQAEEAVAAASAPETATGGETTEEQATNPAWLDPEGKPLPFADVSEVLDFLAKAKVVSSTTIRSGVTLPRKLLLERDGVRAHAIFHDVKIEKRRERLSGGQVVSFFRDHYANNVAAFELSRLLGMTNVPPAVVRRVGHQQGSVQMWIESANTEADRRRQKIVPAGNWRLTAKDMQVFDNLSNNIDRNQGNILYDASWNLWFIDHTRTFGRTKKLPSPARVTRCSYRLWQALHELDEAELRRRLKPYLGTYEIGGLVARKELLIALIEERIAESGEAAVLFSYDDPPSASAADEDDLAVPEAPPS